MVAYLSLVSSGDACSKNTILNTAGSKMVKNCVVGIIEDAAIILGRGGAVENGFAQKQREARRGRGITNNIGSL